MLHYINAEGEIQLPEALRQQLSLRAGMPVRLFAEGNQIILQPLNAVYFATLRGLLLGEGLSTEFILAEKARERELEEQKLKRLMPTDL